ncbi:Uma2 family endonuclease [Pseudonocardia sichuanensis]|uniref:Putative restriction endonuclease n=1 Tax=Pseudonocardia kunmingensis TaxID=630975 RepID=A0A543DX43_9PSEU|nr:Uma2 family endonuclease [Pseudonocardia kunmingensis]TQM13900.1 putative restriction endonuclease [Pseudonocardia kunmingensis]
MDLFDHEGPWTEDAYLTLTHDGRVEVVDGTLLVGPAAGPQRVRVIERVRAAVAAALPAGLRVRGPQPLRLGTDCVLVPDLVITAAPGAEGEEPPAEEEDAPAVLDAAAALMVIEVVGCDHGATDRTFKPQLYARSRIPYSLLIDHDGPFAVAEMIIGGRYHEYAHGGERLQIEEPFALDLDLTAVTADEEPPAEAPVETPAEAGA